MNKRKELESLGIYRVFNDNTESFDMNVIQHAFAKMLINSWEYEFYYDVHMKDYLTEKQKNKKVQINKRLLEHFTLI